MLNENSKINGIPDSNGKVEPALLPEDQENQIYVSLSALEAGWIHLPEREFIEPHDAKAVHKSPSLAFFLYHQPTNTRMIYDLGLRRDVEKYPPKVARRCTDGTRIIEVPKDVKESIEQGGISANDIDVIVLSHVHYDHTGNPDQFPNAKFIVGPGSLSLLEAGVSNPEDTWFLPSLLPTDKKRITELPDESSSIWKPLGLFSHTWDYFGDGSFYIINSPGHVEGHINGLVRIGPQQFILLGSDSCHDTRLLEGTCCIARFEHPGEKGVFRSVHSDDKATASHIEKLRKMRDLTNGRLQVILAHDRDWVSKNGEKFLPNRF